MVISFSRKWILSVYLLVILVDLLFIVVLMIGVQNQPSQRDVSSYFWFSKLDLKNESNLGTWYSSIILFIAACLALFNLQVNTYTRQWKWIYLSGWSLAACLLFLLSADESAVLHESIASIALLERGPANRAEITLGAGDWIPFLLPFMIASVVGLLAFMSFTFYKCNRALLPGLAGVICWIGSIIGEAIEGKFIKLEMSRPLEGLIEESLEIVGTTLLMIAFAEHFQWRQRQIESKKVIDSPDTEDSQKEQTLLSG
jgi:hypothetical protein